MRFALACVCLSSVARCHICCVVSCLLVSLAISTGLSLDYLIVFDVPSNETAVPCSEMMRNVVFHSDCCTYMYMYDRPKSFSASNSKVLMIPMGRGNMN
jgi:hypothetical protein